jgi:hypothetical protein
MKQLVQTLMIKMNSFEFRYYFDALCTGIYFLNLLKVPSHDTLVSKSNQDCGDKHMSKYHKSVSEFIQYIIKYLIFGELHVLFNFFILKTIKYSMQFLQHF